MGEGRGSHGYWGGVSGGMTSASLFNVPSFLPLKAVTASPVAPGATFSNKSYNLEQRRRDTDPTASARKRGAAAAKIPFIYELSSANDFSAAACANLSLRGRKIHTFNVPENIILVKGVASPQKSAPAIHSNQHN